MLQQSSNIFNYIGPVLLIIFIVTTIGIIAYFILKSPFEYPYFDLDFDVSRKRKPRIEDYIDGYLNDGNFGSIKSHNQLIKNWKETCNQKIEKSHFPAYRMKQYAQCLDDANAFRFHFTRQQTRYKQQNYVKTSYKVTQRTDSYSYSYSDLCQREHRLNSINHECSIHDYNCKNQRRLMTKELRRQIMERDNYTCQNCGKYMPDEVGLHIDHIVPVSKGGKTLASNLQVLCSKCNGSKSNK